MNIIVGRENTGILGPAQISIYGSDANSATPPDAVIMMDEAKSMLDGPQGRTYNKFIRNQNANQSDGQH